MRKILLTIMALGTAISVQAQLKIHSKPIIGTSKANVLSPKIDVDVAGNEIPLQTINPTTVATPKLNSPLAATIGNTTYDLQTNAAICNRVVNGGGHVSATWTRSVTNDLAASDRGTGYNHKMSGGSWGPPPSARIEPVRTGWPSIARTAAGTEHVIAHIANQPLYISSSPTGGGSWTFGSLPSIGPPEVLWGRLAAGGANGNTLHALMITLPTGNGGALYNGLNGCPIYQRSQDNGATWDITNLVPVGVDDQTYNGWSADAYAIDARGNTVAFTHGQITEDWAMWKSTDNGNTWTKTIIWDFPFTKYNDTQSITDVDGDGIADTVLTVDHKVAILIDNNGMVHCWVGAVYVIDADVAGPLGLFLSTDALLYWNESMGSNGPVVIAQTPDIDGDGVLTFAQDYIPRYGNGGQCSQPHAAIDASGNIIVSFVAPLENSSSGNSGYDYSYRSIWMIGSTDGGNTWTDPVQVAGSDFDEAVFGALARDIQGNCVDLVYQFDGLPGIAVQPPGNPPNQAYHPFGNNDIVHDCIPLTSVLGIKDVQALPASVSVHPNPVSDMLNVSVNAKGAQKIKISITDITGKVMYSDLMNTAGTGLFNFSHSVKNFAKGMYLLSINADGAVSTSKFVVQ